VSPPRRAVTAPLDGVAVCVDATGGAGRSARRLLRRLGAEIVTRGPTGRLAGEPEPDEGIPPGTMEHAAGLLGAGASLRAVTAGTDVVVTRAEAASEVLLPLRHDPPGWATPSSPVPVGRGAIHTDLGEEDAAAFRRLLPLLGDRAGEPEAVAAAAQEWRLAVTPYRAPPTPAPPPAPLFGTTVGVSCTREIADALVVDLTTMWAGPLATRLLAAGGIEVVRVDAAGRPDGVAKGSPSAYAALDAGKRHVTLDLDSTADRAAFTDLVATADLVIDSYSRRVMPNFGFTPEALRRIRPSILTMSLPAFSIGTPEAAWVALGAGVHAASGRGWRDGRPWAPIVAYPDALAGLTAHVVALAVLLGRRRGWAPRHAEVSLASSLAPRGDRID
jgi:CoA-transferase family III